MIVLGRAKKKKAKKKHTYIERVAHQTIHFTNRMTTQPDFIFSPFRPVLRSAGLDVMILKMLNSSEFLSILTTSSLLMARSRRLKSTREIAITSKDVRAKYMIYNIVDTR